MAGTDVLESPSNYFVNNYFSATDYTGFGHIANAYRIKEELLLAGNGYLGTCYADFEIYSVSKFGPPVTAYAVCASSTNAATLQATSSGIATLQATSADTSSQPQQGEPSEEALLLLESLRESAAERERLFNER